MEEETKSRSRRRQPQAARDRPDAGRQNNARNRRAPREIEEAEEERNIEIHDEEEVESEPSGEDLMDNLEQDYRPIAELDEYEAEGVDDEDYDEMDPEARRQADEVVRQRHLEQLALNQRIPQALLEDETSSMSMGGFREERRNAQRMMIEEDEGDDDEIENDDKFLDANESRGRLTQWINEPRTQRFITRTFKNFLRKFPRGSSNALYIRKIEKMYSHNKQSLEVDYQHLMEYLRNPTLGLWLLEQPALILPHLHSVAGKVVLEHNPEYNKIHSDVYVRITGLPYEERLRDLRRLHLNQLVQIRGVITRRYPVYSQLKKIYYICGRCGDRKGPIYQNESATGNVVANGESNRAGGKLGACAACQANGPFVLDYEGTVYRNHQRITLQEIPGEVPPGRVPRHKDVVLLGDLIDCAKPGEKVLVTGIYSNRFEFGLNVKHGFPIFSTLIEANHVKLIEETGQNAEMTPDDLAEIKELSKKANIRQLICNSLAPSLHGHPHVKKALALSIFGGEPAEKEGHRVRGDINLLMLGDPGLAKSQFLKCVEQTFPRTVFTTGKGASAVGLTASVRKDPASREWTLEVGALVLADKGICLIDEFDKMNDSDRTSIHEAMEQQSISISKAGIITSLSARCAVIAAANPIKGRYDPQLSFKDNVELSDPILSRFDILCVLKDEVDSVRDRDLATFIINSHIKSHPSPSLTSNLLSDGAIHNETIRPEILKKYIRYAREKIHPKITNQCTSKLSAFYAELRKEASGSGGLNIVVRHLESLVRMCQASAKMRLDSEVRMDDVDLAISVLMESFIQSQKFTVAQAIRSKFRKYLVAGFHDDESLLMHQLAKMFIERVLIYSLFLFCLACASAQFGKSRDNTSKFSAELKTWAISEFL